ncbi:MAG: 3-hydroxyacyl-CoA dehydrogenase NAD-binding domain-containing protein [Gammaproteobacteria bacterium]|nr:3-hydroxyacyl-CoA dehydrogenase NAD-binding domain-containing protein [Gammaproteobacteria bacterium]
MSEHFRLTHDAGHVAWLAFDMADSTVNVLSEELLLAFEEQLIAVAQGHPAGLVLTSAKPGGFIAGADIKRFERPPADDQAERLILRVHEILQRLEALAFPTVALIDGHCLGGGLELALACDYRIASTEAHTRLGFPEVRLGIFPGFGGTVRATRTMGHLRALEQMLGGATVDARRAATLGLVDHALPPRQLANAARRLIAIRPSRHQPSLLQRLAGLAPARWLLTPVLRRGLARRVPEHHYPAPYALLHHWQHHGGRRQEMYANEARAVPALLRGDTARNLIRVFRLKERLKGLAGGGAFQPRRVHVMGAGAMGGDIAAWCAMEGLMTTLHDPRSEAIGAALARGHDLFRGRLKDPYRVRAAADRLMPDPRNHGLAGADVVIEAIVEDATAKRALYAEAERAMAPTALLATNTSSLPLEALGRDLERPGRLVGLHFFNPVSRMELVEVVTGEATEQAAVDQALAFTRCIHKLPLPVAATPGFLVNRVLMPYLLEAMALLEEGANAPRIDAAARHFGMPVGPVELADRVGLDICLRVAEELAPLLDADVPTLLRRHVEAGRLGRKSGHGFYGWRHGRAVSHRARHGAEDELADRLILPLINEAVACLRQGVVADADLLDAGLVFGAGFAPFRGGPMAYARERGTGRVQARLRQLETRHGRHFHADSGWAAVG